MRNSTGGLQARIAKLKARIEKLRHGIENLNTFCRCEDRYDDAVHRSDNEHCPLAQETMLLDADYKAAEEDSK